MLTNIPVSKQVWRGWPESIADELSLAQIGISRKHKLYVKPKDETSRNVSPNFFFHIYFFMYTGSLQKFDGVECFTVLNINGGLLI